MKRCIVFLSAILLISTFFCVLKNTVFDFTALSLNQTNTFVAISENDESGYNRWIPFYFTLAVGESMSTKDVENYLNEKISKVIIYGVNEEPLYSTSDLIWSACQLDDKTYSLTLVVVPVIGDFPITGVETLEKIEFFSGMQKKAYKFDEYRIEQRETIPETELYVSTCSVETIADSTFKTQIYYGIIGSEYDILDFALSYPIDFTDIREYNIVNKIYTEEYGVEYTLDVMLNEQNSKVVFRPFIRVTYNDKKGWLIPSVPVFFR